MAKRVLWRPSPRLFALLSSRLMTVSGRISTAAAMKPMVRRGASVMTMPFKDNVLTSDPARYARSAGVLAASPDLALGWWTIGWAHAAFRLWARFEDPDYARQILGPPMLVVGSGADRVVDMQAIERFVSRLRSGRLIVIDGAQHEILVERDALRDKFWAAFDKFIPGVEGERPAHSAARGRAADFT